MFYYVPKTYQMAMKSSQCFGPPTIECTRRGRRAQIRFSRRARGEKQEKHRPPFWFCGEGIRTSVHGNGGNAEVVHWLECLLMSS